MWKGLSYPRLCSSSSPAGLTIGQLQGLEMLEAVLETQRLTISQIDESCLAWHG
jgi:hypothetical protein